MTTLCTPRKNAVAMAAALLALGGCGNADPVNGSGPPTAGGVGDDGGSSGSDAGLIQSDAHLAPDCAPGTQYVYLLDLAGSLYRFDPPTLALSKIGPLNCPVQGHAPFSMAVDRKGQAWVVYGDGSLYRVDTSNAACTPTSFVPNQEDFLTFGMGFSTNGPGSTTDTLFVTHDSLDASVTLKGLATIDTSTLVLTPIAQYDALGGRDGELTGTGDGRLFGAFEGTPFVVAEIEKASAKILTQAPQAPIQFPPRAANIAFAFWGGDFYVFAGIAFSTDVYHYRPSTGTTTLERSYSQLIIGAGVSTCAPTEPPR